MHFTKQFIPTSGVVEYLFVSVCGKKHSNNFLLSDNSLLYLYNYQKTSRNTCNTLLYTLLHHMILILYPKCI
ncbi:hypothetical protein MKHDV_00741 [Halodesulfovibrio sp. MK-HDV]|nr:hypothetical protein MKHDV_00741 [Halodesulfovibrio sp. MK-HDV]